eukprot:GEMP01007786.1.p1 GENE.GEMP01007786.1~~GEMP01007786.1.p1  ORF type:complete len:890 (+),score=165.55 GEMP01007786.1:2-2671(+)
MFNVCLLGAAVAYGVLVRTSNTKIIERASFDQSEVSTDACSGHMVSDLSKTTHTTKCKQELMVLDKKVAIHFGYDMNAKSINLCIVNTANANWVALGASKEDAKQGEGAPFMKDNVISIYAEEMPSTVYTLAIGSLGTKKTDESGISEPEVEKSETSRTLCFKLAEANLKKADGQSSVDLAKASFIWAIGPSEDSSTKHDHRGLIQLNVMGSKLEKTTTETPPSSTEEPEACVNTDGTTGNTKACQCGTMKCDAAKKYCNGAASQCSEVKMCSDTGGTMENAVKCQCGTEECDGTSKQYCNAAANQCSAVKFCISGQICPTSDGCKCQKMVMTVDCTSTSDAKYFCGDSTVDAAPVKIDSDNKLTHAQKQGASDSKQSYCIHGNVLAAEKNATKCATNETCDSKAVDLASLCVAENLLLSRGDIVSDTTRVRCLGMHEKTVVSVTCAVNDTCNFLGSQDGSGDTMDHQCISATNVVKSGQTGKENGFCFGADGGVTCTKTTMGCDASGKCVDLVKPGEECKTESGNLNTIKPCEGELYDCLGDKGIPCSTGNKCACLAVIKPAGECKKPEGELTTMQPCKGDTYECLGVDGVKCPKETACTCQEICKDNGQANCLCGKDTREMCEVATFCEDPAAGAGNCETTIKVGGMCNTNIKDKCKDSECKKKDGLAVCDSASSTDCKCSPVTLVGNECTKKKHDKCKVGTKCMKSDDTTAECTEGSVCKCVAYAPDTGEPTSEETCTKSLGKEAVPAKCKCGGNVTCAKGKFCVELTNECLDAKIEKCTEGNSSIAKTCECGSKGCKTGGRCIGNPAKKDAMCEASAKEVEEGLSVGAIVGIVSGVVCLLIVLLTVFLFCERGQPEAQKPKTTPTAGKAPALITGEKAKPEVGRE